MRAGPSRERRGSRCLLPHWRQWWCPQKNARFLRQRSLGAALSASLRGPRLLPPRSFLSAAPSLRIYGVRSRRSLVCGDLGQPTVKRGRKTMPGQVCLQAWMRRFPACACVRESASVGRMRARPRITIWRQALLCSFSALEARQIPSVRCVTYTPAPRAYTLRICPLSYCCCAQRTPATVLAISIHDTQLKRVQHLIDPEAAQNRTTSCPRHMRRIHTCGSRLPPVVPITSFTK